MPLCTTRDSQLSVALTLQGTAEGYPWFTPRTSGAGVTNLLPRSDTVLHGHYVQLLLFSWDIFLIEASILSDNDVNIFSCSISLTTHQDRNHDVVRWHALAMNCSSWGEDEVPRLLVVMPSSNRLIYQSKTGVWYGSGYRGVLVHVLHLWFTIIPWTNFTSSISS